MPGRTAVALGRVRGQQLRTCPDIIWPTNLQANHWHVLTHHASRSDALPWRRAGAQTLHINCGARGRQARCNSRKQQEARPSERIGASSADARVFGQLPLRAQRLRRTGGRKHKWRKRKLHPAMAAASRLAGPLLWAWIRGGGDAGQLSGQCRHTDGHKQAFATEG